MLPVQRPELDAIYRQTVGKQARTICVTAANAGEGVSTLALSLASRGAAAGLKALLIDANLARPSVSARLGLAPRRWAPADGSARAAATFVDRMGMSILPAPVAVDPLAFRDPERWRRMFEADLAGYDLIVVDTSPVNGFSDRAIPAELIAAACSATVLVVLAGVSSERTVRAAVERLATAGAALSGAVLNDRFNPSLADELTRWVGWLGRFAPPLARWLQRRIDASVVLHLQI